MIQDLSEKMHALAIAVLVVGAFAVTSALADPGQIQSRTFAGGCIGGYYCGGFQSFLRGEFPTPVLLNSVQFTVNSIPVSPYGRVYVDIYVNGQRVVQGVDVTGYNQFRSVPLPPVSAWDIVIAPATFDSIQFGNVTALYTENCGPGNIPHQPNYPGNPTSETIHCGSINGQIAHCASSFSQISNIQIVSSTPGSPGSFCQNGTNWGVSGNTIWVSNGCVADFLVQGTH